MPGITIESSIKTIFSGSPTDTPEWMNLTCPRHKKEIEPAEKNDNISEFRYCWYYLYDGEKEMFNGDHNDLCEYLVEKGHLKTKHGAKKAIENAAISDKVVGFDLKEVFLEQKEFIYRRQKVIAEKDFYVFFDLTTFEEFCIRSFSNVQKKFGIDLKDIRRDYRFGKFKNFLIYKICNYSGNGIEEFPRDKVVDGFFYSIHDNVTYQKRYFCWVKDIVDSYPISKNGFTYGELFKNRYTINKHRTLGEAGL